MALSGHGAMSDMSPLSGVKRKPDFGAVRSAFDPRRDITRTRREPRGDPRSLVIRRRSILSRRLALFREEFSDLHPVVPQPRADLAPSLNARAWPWDVREWPNVWTGVGGRIARYIVSGWALIWL
jgi:hypothetical protein